MYAQVEKPDGIFERMEMEPSGCIYCDNCGDCIICGGGCYCEWNQWVIYLFEKQNPYYGEKRMVSGERKGMSE